MTIQVLLRLFSNLGNTSLKGCTAPALWAIHHLMAFRLARHLLSGPKLGSLESWTLGSVGNDRERINQKYGCALNAGIDSAKIKSVYAWNRFRTLKCSTFLWRNRTNGRVDFRIGLTNALRRKSQKYQFQTFELCRTTTSGELAPFGTCFFVKILQKKHMFFGALNPWNFSRVCTGKSWLDHG